MHNKNENSKAKSTLGGGKEEGRWKGRKSVIDVTRRFLPRTLENLGELGTPRVLKGKWENDSPLGENSKTNRSLACLADFRGPSLRCPEELKHSEGLYLVEGTE